MLIERFHTVFFTISYSILCVCAMCDLTPLHAALFSIGYDEFGTYHATVWLSLAVLIVLLIAAVIIPQDDPIPLVLGQTGDLP